MFKIIKIRKTEKRKKEGKRKKRERKKGELHRTTKAQHRGRGL